MDLMGILSCIGVAGIIMIIVAIAIMVLGRFSRFAVIAGLVIAGVGAYFLLISAGIVAKPTVLDFIPSEKWSF
ncbi:MAG: hypothetical protein RBR26_05570 [Methanosarcina mazei]|nr:hypothetical protein [Methanosarcina mazei]